MRRPTKVSGRRSMQVPQLVDRGFQLLQDLAAVAAHEARWAEADLAEKWYGNVRTLRQTPSHVPQVSGYHRNVRDLFDQVGHASLEAWRELARSTGAFRKQDQRLAGFNGSLHPDDRMVVAGDMRPSNGKDVEERLGETGNQRIPLK